MFARCSRNCLRAESRSRISNVYACFTRTNSTSAAGQRRFLGVRVKSFKNFISTLRKHPIWPVLIGITLFGSELIHIMRKRTELEDMKRVYNLKIHKLEDVIKQLESGERVNVEEEMKIVEETFQRFKRGVSTKSEASESAKISDLIREQETKYGLDDSTGLEDVLAELTGNPSKQESDALVGSSAESTDLENTVKETKPARQTPPVERKTSGDIQNSPVQKSDEKPVDSKELSNNSTTKTVRFL